MRTNRRAALYLLSLLFAVLRVAAAQTAVPTVVLQGLRSSLHHGSFNAARYAPDGSLLLLYDGGDGVRLLRTDPAGSHVLAEVQEGAAGDVGLAMALDPGGNIYIAGTSSSGALDGTAGAAFPHSQDSSTNSFLARFDPGLHLQFLTFLGAGRTAVTGVAATADAAFVTGTTFASSFSTTAGSALPQAGAGSTANGFVERFTADGSALVYSTLLTGAGGDSEPYGIVADASDHAYAVGETSSSSFPAVAALVPVMTEATAGFFLKLTPAGDALLFSSFVPGSGLTGIDLDATGSSVLLSGDVDIARFPIANVSGPLANTTYQSLLRWSTDGTQVLSSTSVAPGTSSEVAAAPDGTVWVSGSLTVPLFASGDLGDSFFAHVNTQSSVDAAGRFGGMVVANAASASLSGAAAAPAVNASGTEIAFAGMLEATANASASLPRFDVALSAAPNELLPDLPSGLLPGSCDGTSQCLGSAGLLTLLQTSGAGPGLSLSTGNLPLLTLRNSGATDASAVALSASGYSLLSDCGATVQAASQCGILLSGAGPGSLTVSAAGSSPIAVSLPVITAPRPPLSLSTSELDFGIVTATSPGSRTVTITNLSASSQSFASSGDDLPSTPPYTLTETASTCAGTAEAHTVAASSSCTVTLGLAASTLASNDGPVQVSWQIAGQDIAVTAITQAAELSLSSPQVDFGTSFAAPAIASLPRYLYLSNSSGTAIAHNPVPSPATGPFTVVDECPSTLEPKTVCRLTLTYTPSVAPSVDSLTLALDDGLSVLVTGEYLPGSVPAANLPTSSITAEPASVTFPDAVTTTEISATPQVVTITNSGAVTVPLAVAVIGDFSLSNACGPTLAAGTSCELTLQFAPSQPGLRKGLLSVSTGPGSGVLDVQLLGSAAPLLPPTNGTLILGSSPVGEPTFAWYRVGSAFDSLTASVAGAGFRAALIEDDGTGHGVLPASAFAPQVTGSCRDCWLGIAMTPVSTGAQTGTLTLTTAAGGRPYQLSLLGNGTSLEGLVASPSEADLGTVPVGSTSAPLTLTLANLLGSNAAVSILSMTTSGDFQAGLPIDGQLPCTSLLSATATCRFTVTFSPTAAGERTGTVLIRTSGGAVSIPLSGSAVAGTGLAVNPTALTFTSASGTPSAGAAQQTIRLTNNTNEPMELSPVTTTDPSFVPTTTCGVLQPAASCTIGVTFTPGSSEAFGSLNFSARVGEGTNATPMPVSVPLYGTYTATETGLVLLPANVDFGAQAVDMLGQLREFTLLNTSSTMQTVALNPPQNFPLATPFACTTLEPGASCTFSLLFLPETGGPLTGSVLATGTDASGASAQAIGYLLGYGIGAGQLTLSGDVLAAGVIDFGQVTSGASVQQTLTMTNSGTDPLNVRRIVSEPPFTASSTCGPVLAPGGQCQVTLTYAPVYQFASALSSALPRADAELLTIASDALSSPDQVKLIGTALPASSDGGKDPTALASYTLSAGALTFPNTAPGVTSPAQNLTVTNTGSVPLALAAQTSSPDFLTSSACAELQPSSSCVLSVAFEPGSGNGPSTHAATLAIQSNALNTLEFVSLLGLSTSNPLAMSTANLDFGSLPVGDTATLPVTITNRTTLPLTLGALTATGDYSVQPGSCAAAGNALPAAATCTLLVEFAPAAAGTRSGLLSIATDALAAPATVALTGVGTTPKLSVSPETLNFGVQQIGTHTALTLSVTNSGTAPLLGVMASLGGQAASDYTVLTACSPPTLAPASGCALQVSFAPTAVGARAATLTLASNDSAGPTVIALSGTGTPATGLNVTVNGVSISTLSVKQGATASFHFAVIPLGGFQGPVALTCTPKDPSPYADCSLLQKSMNLGDGSSASSGSISTRGPVESGGFALGALFCALPLLVAKRRGRGPRTEALLAFALSLGLFFVSGCGGPGSTGSPLTPRGTYRYSVTATAAGPSVLTASATVVLVVD